MKNFKYSTSFSSAIKTVIPNDYDKYLATASLNSLKDVFSDGLDPEANQDLLYIAANGAVGGISNKNYDCISTADMVKIAPQSINKYFTVEHSRKDGAVGAISNYGFSEYGSNKILTQEEALASKDPVNWVVAGYIWRVLSPGLVKMLIQSSDENSLNYSKCSLSWEILFSEYNLMVGSSNINDAQIITDPDKIEKLSKYLRANGGSGIIKETKESVHRLIVGEMIPAGYSVVARPAASVQGILTIEDEVPQIIPIKSQAEEDKSNEVIEINSIDKSLELAAAYSDVAEINNSITLVPATQKELDFYNLSPEFKEKDNKNKENIKNIATENKKCVNKNTNLSIINKNIKKSMKLKFNDITKDSLESVANTDLYELAKDLNEQSTKFAVERDAKAAEADLAKKEVADVKAKNEALAADLEKVKVELNKLEEARAKEKIQNDFNVRMSDLKEKYTLDAAQARSIAKQIRGLDDETFASWLEDHSAFLVAKETPDFIKEKMDSKKEDEKSKEDDKEDEKECKAKKECKASLIDEIKALKPETKPIENKITVNKTTQEIWAEAFAGLAEVNDVVTEK